MSNRIECEATFKSISFVNKKIVIKNNTATNTKVRIIERGVADTITELLSKIS